MSRRTPTQAHRVLSVLRAVGSRGITAADFARSPAPDGRAPVLDLAGRIAQLRREGHEIVHAGKRDGCRVYRLLEPIRRSEFSATVENSAVDLERQVVPLFGPPRRRPRSPYDDDAA